MCANYIVYIVPEPEHINALNKLCFYGREEDTRFGVIIGPSGSGKTYLMTKLCNEYRKGFLYHEILEPDSFIDGLIMQSSRNENCSSQNTGFVAFICYITIIIINLYR